MRYKFCPAFLKNINDRSDIDVAVGQRQAIKDEA